MEAELFFGGKPELRALFAQLAQRMEREWPETRLRTMKTCVRFDDPRPYLYVSLARGAMTGGRAGLLLSFGLPEPLHHPRFYRVVPISSARYTVHLPVCDASEIDDELVDIVSMSRAMMATRRAQRA